VSDALEADDENPIVFALDFASLPDAKDPAAAARDFALEARKARSARLLRHGVSHVAQVG